MKAIFFSDGRNNMEEIPSSGTMVTTCKATALGG
jgi:hypothetical protein